MAGLTHRGWTNSGKLEGLRSSVLFLFVLFADVVVLRSVSLGPGTMVLAALLALNLVGLVLVIHWARLSVVRRGQWVKIYPLEVATVLDSVLGHFDFKAIRTRSVGERTVYTDSYSDVIRVIDPFFEVSLRAVSLMGKGVAVHVGPMDDINRETMVELMDELDDIIEKDLLEAIPARGRPAQEEE